LAKFGASMNILEEVKYKFSYGNAIIRIIIINVLVFLAFALAHLVEFLFQLNFSQQLTSWFSLPASFSKLFYQPWSIISYMFLHSGPFHLLFNMLWLYWIGQLLQQYLGNSKTYQAYFLGGIFGGLVYMTAYNVFPVFSNQVEVGLAMGASAGVLSVVVAAAALLPNYSIHLFLLGSIRLKYIALITVLIDLISIPQGNAGGHLAHLGGALFGLIFIKLIYSKSNASNVLDSIFEFIGNGFRRQSKLKIHHKGNSKPSTSDSGKPSQADVDAILDKIIKGGYESLSKKEKEILFKAGK
jgi:membrane associated rhomboid family serine protease